MRSTQLLLARTLGTFGAGLLALAVWLAPSNHAYGSKPPTTCVNTQCNNNECILQPCNDNGTNCKQTINDNCAGCHCKNDGMDGCQCYI